MAEVSPNAVLRRIERELAELWSAPQGPGELPKCRACTMNLVVVGAPDLAERYTPIVDDVTRNIPARAIVVALDRNAATGLDGDVTAVCFVGGAQAICSERVTLRARGAVCARVASAIDALCVSEMPTTVVWLGEVHGDDALFASVAEDAQRVIIDSEYSSVASLLELSRWARAERDRPAIADLAWTRLAVWHEMAARFFDEPTLSPLADAITRLAVCQASEPGASLGSEAALFVAWMASRLGWRLDEADPSMLRLVRPDGVEVAVKFGAVARPDGVAPGALASLTIEAQAEGLRLRGSIERQLASGLPDDSPDADVIAWRLEAPGACHAMEQRVRLRTNRGAPLLERTLHRPPHDPAFVESTLLMQELVARGARAT